MHNSWSFLPWHQFHEWGNPSLSAWWWWLHRHHLDSGPPRAWPSIALVTTMSSLVHRDRSSKLSSGVRGFETTRGSSSASWLLFLTSAFSFGGGEFAVSCSSFLSSPVARAGSAMARFRRSVRARWTRCDSPAGKFQSIRLQWPTILARGVQLLCQTFHNHSTCLIYPNYITNKCKPQDLCKADDRRTRERTLSPYAPL